MGKKKAKKKALKRALKITINSNARPFIGGSAPAKLAFDQALDYTFANEGGFSNDKFDHGGATKFGITIAELSKWMKRPASVNDVMNLSAETAKAIYRAWYWEPLSLDQFGHVGEAMAMFDVGVVMGIGIPPKFAQNICVNHGGQIAVDGHIGPKTLLAITQVSEPVFIRDFSSLTEARFRSIVDHNSTQRKFLGGWLNRAHRLLSLMNIPDIESGYKIAQKAIMVGGDKLVRLDHVS
jgi:lysozyme family protein